MVARSDLTAYQSQQVFYFHSGGYSMRIWSEHADQPSPDLQNGKHPKQGDCLQLPASLPVTALKFLHNAQRLTVRNLHSIAILRFLLSDIAL